MFYRDLKGKAGGDPTLKSLKGNELHGEIFKRWNICDESTRGEFNAKADALKEQYDKDLAEFVRLNPSSASTPKGNGKMKGRKGWTHQSNECEEDRFHQP